MINWKVIICSLLYVLATLLLRQSIDSGLTNVNIQIIFSLTIGLLGLILYIYQRPRLDTKSIYPIFSALMFFVANYLLISIISNKVSLGLIRSVLTGLETLLLFVLSYFLWYDKINVYQLVGSVTIIIGIIITSISN